MKKVENLDPLVKVLLEALSSEIFGLSHDIETSQHRILDKIANMLTPDILVSVRPAHSVIHAFPREIPKYTVKNIYIYDKEAGVCQRSEQNI